MRSNGPAIGWSVFLAFVVLLSCLIRDGDGVSEPYIFLPRHAPVEWLPKYPPRVQLYQTGLASWYGGRFHGRRTSNGERYNEWAMTAAHPYLDFGTQVRVTNTFTGCQADLRINDRGPFPGIEGPDFYLRQNRVIDVSRAGAQALCMERAGVVPVEIALLNQPE